jgi:hypothetical protein
MNLVATLSLDNRGFLNPLAAAQGAVSGAVGGMKSAFAGLAAITAGAGALGLAFLGVKKAIGEAADMETMETSFSILLGSIGAAKDRLKELSKFAAATPFALPEIATASRTLETLTRGALSTGAGLTLVGDVASGVNQPFAEVATTVGRLYDGLMNGRPVGEAMARLGELGVISGETRGKLEELQQSGAKGAAVWSIAEAALGRFSGMMAKQSGTWNGLMSTLQDNITAVFREFGTPLIDALKPMLTGAITLADQLSAKAREWGTAVAEGITTVKSLFDQGTLWEAAGLKLKIGFADAADFLTKKLAEGFDAISSNAPSLFASLGQIFEGFGKQLAGSIQKGIAGSLRDLKIGGVYVTDHTQLNSLNMSGNRNIDEGHADVEKGMKGLGGGVLSGIVKGLNTPMDEARTQLAKLVADAKPKPVPEMYGPPMPPAALAAAAAGAAAGPAAAKSDVGDRLAKIGLFIGGGGPANEHARKTAENTSAMRTLLTKGLEIWGRTNPAPIATVG